MPAPLPNTPWLQGPDVGRQFLGGAQIGAEQSRIAQEQQRLQAQATQAEQQRLQEQQRLDIEHQYKQQQMALQKQELQQAQQMQQMKVQEYGRMAQAQMGYTKDIQTMGYLEATKKWGPLLGTSGLGSIYSADVKERPFNPRRVDLGGGHEVYESAPNKFDEFKATLPPKPPMEETMEGGALKGAYEQSLKDLGIAKQGGNARAIKAAEDYSESLLKKLHELGKPGASSPASGPTTAKFKVVGIAPSSSAHATAAPPSSGPSAFTMPSGPTGVFGQTSPIQMPTQAAQAPAAHAAPSAPPAPKEESRKFGQAYAITEGPYKGMTMMWGKDSWGHGEWQQVEVPTPEWLSKTASTVGGAINKAYHWVEGP